MKQYPMRLHPAFKDNLWGGDRLKKDYHKQTELTPLAESWELSCHKDGCSTIENGPYAGKSLADYLREFPDAAGIRGQEFPAFPILFKLIDAKDNLSIQVHPDDAYAMRVEGEYGKTEMWVVLDCQPGSKLVYGFKEPVTKEIFQAHIEQNTLMDLVNEVEVHKGDVFFIASGTLHAIGKGIVIAEIQQSSNTTYRVYDYGRKDANGNPRALHIEKALDVTNLEPYHPQKNHDPVRQEGGAKVETLADCRYFHTDRIHLSGETRRTVDEESFEGIFCAEGTAVLCADETALTLQKGDTVFLPAGMGTYTLRGEAMCLSMRV